MLETVNLILLGRLIVSLVHPFLVKRIGNSLELMCSIIFLFLVTVHVWQKVFAVMIDSYT